MLPLSNVYSYLITFYFYIKILHYSVWQARIKEYNDAKKQEPKTFAEKLSYWPIPALYEYKNFFFYFFWNTKTYFLFL